MRTWTVLRAAWLGLGVTPLVVLAGVLLVAVTAGSATPSAAGAQPADLGRPVAHVTALGRGSQTLAALQAYWTPERIASAIPMRAVASGAPARSEGTVEPLDGSAPLAYIGVAADGTVRSGTLPAARSQGYLSVPYHWNIPFDSWEWFGRYLRNVPAGSPNVAIAMQHKMLFSQDRDGDGDTENYVCSSSTAGPDGVWTAGHCVNNGLPAASDGFNDGWSVNVMHCPSYDSSQGGINPIAGCWGTEALYSWGPQWVDQGNLEYDFGGSNPQNTGTVQAGQIGSFTGVPAGVTYWQDNGYSLTEFHTMAFGYPALSPYSGGKIQACSSQLGYSDDSSSGAEGISIAIGCGHTGGVDGGPWYNGFGTGPFFNYLRGHSSWRHQAQPYELAGPIFNCRAFHFFRTVNSLPPGICP